MNKIKVIAGSTRPGRFNIQPAVWITELLNKKENIEVELLDLKAIDLPFLDESNPPSIGKYENSHTKAWAEKIGEADGFVFITPEYNHSYSPALKNALDYLYQEWNYKPATFISYGSLAGGSRAVEHLRAIAAELKIYDLREQILLPNYWENMNGEGEYQFNGTLEESANTLIDSLVFWAGQMKTARAELASQ